MEERQWFEDRCKEHRATILALAELCRPAVAHYMRTQERAAMSNALSQGAKEAAKAEAEKLGKLLDEIDSIPSPHRRSSCAAYTATDQSDACVRCGLTRAAHNMNNGSNK